MDLQDSCVKLHKFLYDYDSEHLQNSLLSLCDCHSQTQLQEEALLQEAFLCQLASNIKFGHFFCNFGVRRE